MSIFDKIKKKKPVPQTGGYHREKSDYQKPGESHPLQQEPDTVELRPDADDALKKLYEDESVRQRMREELDPDGQAEQNSLGQMLGKGVGTLGDSLRRGSRGQDLLGDSRNKDSDQTGDAEPNQGNRKGE